MIPLHSTRPEAARLHPFLRAAWLAVFLSVFCAFSAAFAPLAHAQNTQFLSNTSDTLGDGDGTYYEEFSVDRTTTFDLRFASDYAASCVIVSPDTLDSFLDGDAYRYFAGFESQFGTKRFTLAPGDYYLAVRNEANADNPYSVELDTALALSPDSNSSYSFARWGIAGNRFVDEDGGVLYHGFNIAAGERTFLDGCNSGVDTYIVAANQLNRVLNGDSFNYFPAYSGENDGALPGFAELILNPGSYYLVFINESGIRKTATYQMEVWRRNTASSSNYLDLQSPASWRLSNSRVTFSVAKILNTSSVTTSGSLRLALWALRSPYNGGSNSGVSIASYDLNPLRPRYQYSNLRPTLNATRPRGTYYTAFLLYEWNGRSWAVRDWINISGRTTFDAPRDTRAQGSGETSPLVTKGAPAPDASVVSKPAPASRTLSSAPSTRTRRASGSARTSSREDKIAAPEIVAGVIQSDVLVGRSRAKATPGSSSPKSSAGSS